MKTIYSGAITFMTGITCSAVAYSAKSDPLYVIVFCFGLAAAGGAFAIAKEQA